MLAAIDQLLAGETAFVQSKNLPEKANFAEWLLLPGSFNPLHCGHERLLLAASTLTQRTGIFELSVTNVDKAALDREEILRRFTALTKHGSAVLTKAPTFMEKARLFPGAWFVLGFDTAIRLLSPKYHADVPAMLQRFKTLGTKFIVAGRLHENAFQTLEQLHIPAGLEALFIPLPASTFREDISSTELRQR